MSNLHPRQRAKIEADPVQQQFRKDLEARLRASGEITDEPREYPKPPSVASKLAAKLAALKRLSGQKESTTPLGKVPATGDQPQIDVSLGRVPWERRRDVGGGSIEIGEPPPGYADPGINVSAGEPTWARRTSSDGRVRQEWGTPPEHMKDDLWHAAQEVGKPEDSQDDEKFKKLSQYFGAAPGAAR